MMDGGSVGVDVHYGCGFTMLGLALVRVLIHGPLLKGNSMPCVPVDTQLQQCPFLGEGLGGPVDAQWMYKEWVNVATQGIGCHPTFVPHLSSM